MTCKQAVLFLMNIPELSPKKVFGALQLVDRPSQLVKNLGNYAAKLIELWGSEVYSAVRGYDAQELVLSVESGLNYLDADYVTFLDEDYPSELKELSDLPLVLYIKGDRKYLTSKKFAIVGTRSPSPYGKRLAREFADELSRAGFIITSGMARGIDTIAHKTAIDNNMPTVAVWGTGLDCIYPAENKELAKQIVRDGLIITEFPLKTPPLPYNFPGRNRIISAMSDGVFVPEAGEKSGSLITLNYAIDQGKGIYIAPGNIYSPQSKGANKFLKKYQAAIVTDVNDLLEDLYLDPKKKAESGIALDFMEQLVVSELQKREMHFDELLAVTGLEVSGLNAIITALCLEGVIEETGNNYYYAT